MMYNIDKIRELLNSRSWRWASTYIDIPHEYIVRGKCGLTDEDFLYIVGAQRELGVHERWGKYNFPYLYVDGYKYWTMGNSFDVTKIINRQKVFCEFDILDTPIMTSRDEDLYKKAVYAIKLFGKPIYEIGCGEGKLTHEGYVTPQNYNACEPSKKLVEVFRTKCVGFYRNINNKSFEENVNRWKDKDCVIVSLFGSASYVMHQYLSMIPQFSKPHFLMFYKENFCPEEFKDMHHFNYSIKDLKSIFPNSFMYDGGDYLIVSSMKLR